MRTPVRGAPTIGVVVAAWPGTAGAERALHSLRVARAGITSSMTAVATVAVEPGGDVRTLEVTGADGASGFAQGAVLGTVLRVLTGGIGWLVPGADGVPARSAGSSWEWARALGERITRGSSVLVAVVDPAVAGRVARVLSDGGADTATALLDGSADDGVPGLPAVGSVVAVRSDAVVMRALDDVDATAVPVR